MVTIFPAEKRKPSFSEKLSGAVGTGLNYLSERENQKKIGQQLKQLTDEDISALQPDIQKEVLKYSSKGKQESAETARKLQREQVEDEIANEAIFKLTGQDLSGLPRDMQKAFVQQFARTPDFQNVRQALKKSGASEEDADLYTYLTIGGQTALVKDLLEKQKRAGNIGQKLPGSTEEQEFVPSEEEMTSSEEKPISERKTIYNELDDFIKKQDIGLIPSEKIARGKERFDTGLKQYQEASTKLRGLSTDKSRLEILEDLNKTDKLPKGLGRIAVDNEGNLRWQTAALASPEAQRYVKILNEFSSSAKDTFGSRVTNFDLSQYLKRFPTLLNSKEGRRQLLQQMKIVNDINSVYYKNLKDVYDKSGGVRNIDADVSERYAERLSEREINKLTQKFKEIGEFESKPSALEFKGRKIRDKKTGEVLISDGENWIPKE